MEKKYLDLSDISAYRVAYELSNYIWEIVLAWEYLARDTIGKQYIKAVDSVSANIAEGFGRFGKKDKIHFYRYSFGSLKESWDWTEKAYNRKLLSSDQYERIGYYLAELPREINNLIKFTDEKLSY